MTASYSELNSVIQSLALRKAVCVCVICVKVVRGAMGLMRSPG